MIKDDCIMFPEYFTVTLDYTACSEFQRSHVIQNYSLSIRIKH